MIESKNIRDAVSAEAFDPSPSLDGLESILVSDYANERHLVEHLIDQLGRHSPWGSVATGQEFPFHGGRTDVVAVDDAGRVIAFEAKLTKWRDAMQQAYRNTCFAHCSFVVLPKAAAIRAARASADFSRRRVGICYIDDKVYILHDAVEVEPLQPWLSERALVHATTNRGTYAVH